MTVLWASTRCNTRPWPLQMPPRPRPATPPPAGPPSARCSTSPALMTQLHGYLRHRFDCCRRRHPIAATGIRIKVSDGSTGHRRDRSEPAARIRCRRITNFIDDHARRWLRHRLGPQRGELQHAQQPGARAGQRRLDLPRRDGLWQQPARPLGVHFIRNVNDGLYGNAHSWIPDFVGDRDPAPFIGINFGKRRSPAATSPGAAITATPLKGLHLSSTAPSASMSIQVTTVANPGVATPEACGPTPEAGWVTVGTIKYKADDLKYFNSYLRHRFDVAQGGAPIAATGIRIKVPNNQSAIDEIEVNSNLAIEQNAVRITNAPGFTIAGMATTGSSTIRPPGPRRRTTARWPARAPRLHQQRPWTRARHCRFTCGKSQRRPLRQREQLDLRQRRWRHLRSRSFRRA